ncbi:MAG: F0F1 ATP synthase subunit B [Elusimicrobia bacterium]|nr:F0F1 ATP synthase subunit B [Elusimicrobiota bacterium]
MDKLVTPDPGLMFWTIVTFLALVALLKRFAWGPLLSAIEEREVHLKAQAAAAKEARDEAERIKNEVAAALAESRAGRQEVLDRAAKDGEALLAKFRTAAEDETRKLREKTAAELGREKDRLVGELRREVADLSVLAAEKLLRRSVDPGVEKAVLDDFFKDISKGGRRQ